MESFVFNLDPSKKTTLFDHLKEEGFELSQPPYTQFSAKKKGISLTLYDSWKCVVQGKSSAEFIEFYLEPEIIGSFEKSYPELKTELSKHSDYYAHIGVDESGKGDFFGPLVIAGVYADQKDIDRLKAIGVKDSKTLTPSAIHSLAEKIKSNFVHQIVIINPLKYNEIYQSFKNLNSLLAWGHATVLENLFERTSCKEALIDQFANERVVLQALKRKKIELNLTQRTKGESDPVVAAASILARDGFVQRLDLLSKEAGVRLAKGASPQVVRAAKDLILMHGKEILPHYAKMHFKTLDKLN